MIRTCLAVMFALAFIGAAACSEAETDEPVGESTGPLYHVPVDQLPMPGDAVCGSRTCYCAGITKPPTTFKCKDHVNQVLCQRETCQSCDTMCGTSPGPAPTT